MPRLKPPTLLHRTRSCSDRLVCREPPQTTCHPLESSAPAKSVSTTRLLDSSPRCKPEIFQSSGASRASAPCDDRNAPTLTCAQIRLVRLQGLEAQWPHRHKNKNKTAHLPLI